MVRLANEFLSLCLEAERCLLCIGWMQPTNLNQIGYQLQLAERHFCQQEHSFVYTYLRKTTQAGKHPDIDECLRLASKIPVDIDEYYLFNLILWTDIQDGMLRTYAETVLDFARKRYRADQCYREYRHILCGGTTSSKNYAGKNNRKRQVSYV